MCNCHPTNNAREFLVNPNTRNWTIAITILTLAGVAAIVLLSPLQWIESRIDQQTLNSWIESRGMVGVLAFIVASALLTGLGLPRQLVALSAGYTFSVPTGTVMAIISVSAGALLTFTFSRFVARPWVNRKFPQAAQKIDSFVNDQPFLKILTIRFAPVGTNMLTNLAAGTSALPASTFFLASAAGFLPQTIIFVLIGNGLAVGSHFKLMVALALSVVSLFLGWLIYKRTGKVGDSPS